MVVAIVLLFLFLYLSIRSVGGVVIPASSIEIRPGAGAYSLIGQDAFSDVADWRLKAYFRFFADIPSKIDSGVYTLPDGTTVEKLLTQVLTKKPNSATLKLTILPGWNKYDIDAYLSAQGLPGLLDREAEFLDLFSKKYSFLVWQASLEWYLYPNTHEIFTSGGLESILDKLLSEFDQKIAQKTDQASLRDTLILASIVEKEERNKANIDMVASILKTRLRQNIALWADATTCYIYALTSKECTPSFIQSHARERNAYNTRILRGLPAGPISNMTADVFFATLWSSDSAEYLYYLHGNDGMIRYARTLDEHNINIQKYLR